MKKLALVGVLASACSLTAVGALPSHVIDYPGAFVVNEPTTLSAVTNRYSDEGAAHAIHADLTLDQNTYLRLGDKGTSASTWSLAVGSEPGENPTITVKGGSVFLTTYRDTKGFLDDADDGSVQPSYLYTTMGANGGSGGKFLVQDEPYSGYGGKNSKVPLWMEKLTVSENARTTAETFDVLQLDGKGFADITTIVNENDKPVRILFNGGYLRKNYMNSRGDSLAPATGKTIIAEGINGQDIHFVRQFGSYKVAGGSGTVIFRGNCDLRLSNSGANYPGVDNSNRGSYLISKSASRIQWDYTGDLVVDENGWLLVDGDDLLPYGQGKGGIRLEGTSALDLNGFRAKVNSLVATTTADGSETKVTNVTDKVGTKVSTLVFGADDMDGVFSAFCCQNVNVEKIGAGTLVVSNVTMEGSLTVKAGRVKFMGRNKIPNLILEDDAEVEGGFDLSTDSLRRVQTGGVSGERVVFVQDGDGETLLRAGDELSGMKFDVKGGSVRFAGDCADKFWRYTLTSGMSTGSGALGNVVIEQSAMWLWPSNYAVVSSASADYRNTQTYGIVTNSAAEQAAITSPSQLAEGRCMAEPDGLVWQYDMDGSGRDYNGPDMLFNNSFARLWNVQKYADGSNAKPALGKTNSWYSVTFRLKDSAPPVAGYSVCRTHWSPCVGAWILSSSATGEDGTWKVRDEHVVQWANTTGMYSADADRISEYPHCDDADPDGKSQKFSEKWYNNGVIYRFTQGASDAESLENVRVSVASGAKFDTSYINNAVLSFKELTVDLTAGAGTITKFRPAANGVLYLKNPRAADLRDGSLVARVTLPLTVGEIVDAANLASWKVYVDGVLSSESTLLAKDGQLVVKTPSGMVLIFR